MAMRAFGVSSVLLESDEHLAQMAAYNEYIKSIMRGLPERVRALLDVNVRDARVREWTLGSDGVAELTFITENTVEKISLITLRFSDASAVANDTDDVATLRLLDGRTDLLSSEFDILEDGRYRYQILASPTGELAVTFSDVHIERAPATMDEYLQLAYRPDTGRWGRWADAWLADDPPLHRAAALGQVEEVARLIDAGHGVNDVDLDGDTPLHAAARRVQLTTMRALLAAGADIDHLNSLGASPLSIAARDEDGRGVECLLAAGADINAGPDRSPVLEAACYGSVHSLHLLLAAGGDPGHRDEDGWTVLMHTVDAEQANTARILLAAGADPTVRAPDGRTAGDIARSRRNVELMGLLPAE